MNYGIMFSSAGFGELLLKDIGFTCKVANELVEKRMMIHNFLYPLSKGIYGDITNKDVYDKFKEEFVSSKLDLLIATPPCQGYSLIGKNKNNDQMLLDSRNFLIFQVLSFIKEVNPNYILIENVPRFFDMRFPYKNDFLDIESILKLELSEDYIISCDIYNALDFGIAQDRKRAFIRIYRKGLSWEDPIKLDKKITLKDAIYHLPSIESGDTTDLKWHFGRKHIKSHVECMKHTPTGKTALDNLNFFPKNKNGNKVKAYRASYKRLRWDQPAPTITMRNDAISSQSNVHPGRKLKDGTYSDARVLSVRELFILSSIPEDLNLPSNISEILIRNLVGECVPPLLLKNIIKGIKK
jgi:DNA (cytosine-5)-methyltransferase 1